MTSITPEPDNQSDQPTQGELDEAARLIDEYFAGKRAEMNGEPLPPEEKKEDE